MPVRRSLEGHNTAQPPSTYICKSVRALTVFTSSAVTRLYGHLRGHTRRAWHHSSWIAARHDVWPFIHPRARLAETCGWVCRITGIWTQHRPSLWHTLKLVLLKSSSSPDAQRRGKKASHSFSEVKPSCTVRVRGGIDIAQPGNVEVPFSSLSTALEIYNAAVINVI